MTITLEEVVISSVTFLGNMPVAGEGLAHKYHFRGIRFSLAVAEALLDSSDRDRMKQLLPDLLKKLASQRATAESRLKEMGVAIDERYQNPMISLLEAQH